MTNSTDIMGYTADADLYCPECAALTYDRYVQGIGPCTIANGKALDREGNSVVPAFADDFVGLWLCARCHGEIDFGDVDRCPACGDPLDYCQGHGEIGDPRGYRVLWLHAEGDHTWCQPGCGCDVSVTA